MNRRTFLAQTAALPVAGMLPAAPSEVCGFDVLHSFDGVNYTKLDCYTFPSLGCPAVITEVQIIARAVRQ